MSKLTPDTATPHDPLWRWKAATSLLFTLFIILGVYTVYHHQLDKVFRNPYPLIDPAREFVSQDDFIVNIQPLRNRLADLTAAAEQSGLHVSLYFEFLNTGSNISIRQDARIWPASLPKVPMTMMVMRRIEDGTLTLKQELAITEEDRADHGSGMLWQNPAGTKLSIEELLREMLAESDNTAYLMLRRQMHDDDYVALMNELGLEDLFNAEGKVNAKEYSRIFRSLYSSSFLEREGSQQILKWLAESSYKNYLAASVPSDVEFPHKFGEQIQEHVHLDSGIVYVPNRPYLLTVMVEGTGADGEQGRVETLMHDISKASYDYISAR